MSEFTSQPSADKVAEMLKKCCKDLFSSKKKKQPLFLASSLLPPHSPDILNWLNQFCSNPSKLFTFGKSPKPEDFLLKHFYFSDHRKHRGLGWKIWYSFNSRKSCLLYYDTFACTYLFASKVLTCLVSKSSQTCTHTKKGNLQLKQGIGEKKCKTFKTDFS